MSSVYTFMLRISVVIVWGCLLPHLAFAQEETNFWYFGEQAGMTFSSGVPVPVQDGGLYSFEGCATISDATGALLFYTNGQTVYNQFHQPMSGGEGLLGDDSATQSASILKIPGTLSEYYIFTMDRSIGIDGLRYSKVDMSQDNGLGEVTTKNVFLDSARSEHVTFVRHANNVDVWLLSARLDGTYISYLISGQTITPTPVTSVGSAFLPNDEGYIRSSPDRQHVVSASFRGDFFDVFSFNDLTGELTTRTTVPLTEAYGVEFSPNSDYVYVSSDSGGIIVQYDLRVADADIAASGVVVASNITNVGALSLARDGRIYVAASNAFALSRIRAPNQRGPNVDFQLGAVSLMPKRSKYGLPVFPHFLLSPLASIDVPVEGALIASPVVTVSGEFEPGGFVTVNILNPMGAVVQAFSPVVSPFGAWTLDTSPLIDGTYTIELIGTDPNNRPQTAGPVSFTVDSSAPLLTISSPDDATSDVTPTLSGLGEPGVDVNLEILDDQNNVVQSLSVTPNSSGIWSVDAMSLAEGTYTLTADSTDDAGNVAMSATKLFVVDVTDPTVTLSSPFDGEFTQDNTPNVRGGTEAGSSIEVFVQFNGVDIQRVNVAIDANGMFSGDVRTPLADGTYTIDARAVDSAGNVDLLTHTFTVDTVAPVVSVVAPASMSIINDDTPTLSGTSDSAFSVTVSITDSSGATVFSDIVVVDAQGNWSIDVPNPLQDGTYELIAKSVDSASNIGSTSTTFEVDTTGPPITIDSPLDNMTIGVGRVDVSGTTEPNTTVELELKDSQGMVLSSGTVSSDSNGAWSYSQFQLMTDGSYTVTVTASDSLGNTETNTRSFSVDLTDASLMVESPQDELITSNTKPDITGTTDVDADVSVSIVDDQGDVIDTPSVSLMSDGSWDAQLRFELPDGTYSVIVTATRPNGKSTTVEHDITIDTTAPTTEVLTPADDSISNEADAEISGTSEPGASVRVTVVGPEGYEFETDVIAAQNGSWSIDIGILDDGEYTITALATDDAGNQAEDSVSFTIDTMAPTVSIDSPTLGDTLETTTPLITGTTEPGAQVEVLIDGQVVGTATAGAQGQWSFMITEPLSSGAHTVEATLTDELGNTSTSGEITFEIKPPVIGVTITSPEGSAELEGPYLIVTGTGEPGADVVVTAGGQAQTVTVDEDGQWSTPLELPDGEVIITATSGVSSATVKVNVFTPNPDDIFDGNSSFRGGGCSSTSGSPTGTGMVMMFLLCIGGLLRRRR